MDIFQIIGIAMGIGSIFMIMLPFIAIDFIIPNKVDRIDWWIGNYKSKGADICIYASYIGFGLLFLNVISAFVYRSLV